MKAQRHKKRLLKILTQIRAEVCSLLEDGHLQYPYKCLEEVERDIENLSHEIERTELAK